jgi:hypothetical protein
MADQALNMNKQVVTVKYKTTRPRSACAAGAAGLKMQFFVILFFSDKTVLY